MYVYIYFNTFHDEIRAQPLFHVEAQEISTGRLLISQAILVEHRPATINNHGGIHLSWGLMIHFMVDSFCDFFAIKFLGYFMGYNQH